MTALIGVKLTDLVSIEVHEESLTRIHLVIAAPPTRGEIADDDLEQVTAGACWGNSSDYGPRLFDNPC